MKMDEQKGLDWREQLEMETGIHFRTVNPEEIEKESFLTIKKELGEAFLASYPKEQLPVLLRVIHTTADFFLPGFAGICKWSDGSGKPGDSKGTSDHHGYDDGGVRNQ